MGVTIMAGSPTGGALPAAGQVPLYVIVPAEDLIS
jgi:hypothetical protein